LDSRREVKKTQQRAEWYWDSTLLGLGGWFDPTRVSRNNKAVQVALDFAPKPRGEQQRVGSHSHEANDCP